MIKFAIFTVYSIVLFWIIMKSIVPSVYENRECPCKIKVPSLLFSMITFASGFFILGSPPYFLMFDQAVFLGIMVYFVISGVVYKFDSAAGDSMYGTIGVIVPFVTYLLYPSLLNQMIFLYVITLVITVLSAITLKMEKIHFLYLFAMICLMGFSMVFNNLFISLSFILISVPKAIVVISNNYLKPNRVIDLQYLSAVLQSVGFFILSLALLVL